MIEAELADLEAAHLLAQIEDLALLSATLQE